MAKRFDVAKRENWRKRLAKFDRTNVTVAEFCRQEEVSQASFYYWAKRIRQCGNGGTPQGVPREFSAAPSSHSVPDDFVEVIVGDSIRVRIPTSRLGAVATLVRHLREACLGADDSMETSRFQRITLTPSSTRP